jgi:hypothetical protein
MERAVRQRTIAWAVMISVGLTTPPAWGEIENISGSATATIVQYNGIIEVQEDSSQEVVPLTRPTPPAVARAQLDRLLPNGEVTAAGQAVAILDEPNFIGIGPPNDAGLDLGAFSEDSFTSWFVKGTVTETRSIVLGPADVGGDFQRGERARVQSRVHLSGMMLLMATDPSRDLSGARVNMSIQVLQHEGDQEPVPVLEGEVELVGGSNGSVEIGQTSGVFVGMPLPIIEFSDAPAHMPLARAVLFAGLDLPYEYEAVVGHAFKLELQVRSQLLTIPNGVGAASVFGLPQEGYAWAYERVKRDDGGWRLAERIAQEVDTTGRAYREGPGFEPVPFAPLFSLCGGVGFEAIGFTVMSCWLAFARVGRRRATRRPGGS